MKIANESRKYILYLRNSEAHRLKLLDMDALTSKRRRQDDLFFLVDIIL